jgi:3-dehydroquinate dehydratase / shikimate dehydrogenase
MKTNPAKICVPVCVQRASDLAAAIERAAEVADIVELRLDCLAEGEHDTAVSLLAGQLLSADVPIILTLRSREQGGRNSIDHEARRRFWTSFQDLPSNCLIDLELDLVLEFAARKTRAEPWLDWSRVICSHHDFRSVPADLEEIYERMAATPARVLKIAVQAEDATDGLQIFALLDRARRDSREMIAIAMGPAGIITRILGPSHGSFLTYGSLDDDNATAPGQLLAKQLRDGFRIKQIDDKTQVMGIIGKPVGHSLSPYVHNAAFAAAQINAVYIPFEVVDAARFIRRMAHPRSRELEWRLSGLSVTAPHKSTVLDQMDWLDPVAKKIGAVNTIVARENELHGYNTDAAGFLEPLRHKFGSLKDARCSIIGAGGGARAAMWALRNAGAQVALFVRDPGKARHVSEEFAIEAQSLSSAAFDGFEIVVNATPVGTRGSREHETVATANQFRGVRLAYDLVYNPIETRFLREARAAGAETLGGIEMLLAQAIEQFKLWTGKDPDPEVMRSAAMHALSSRPKSH